MWLGDSRGQWDGDTLVVDTVHFNADTWFDRAGNHHSEALHVVERFSFIDRDHLNYEVTIEDPGGVHETLEDEHGDLWAGRTGLPASRCGATRSTLQLNRRVPSYSDLVNLVNALYDGLVTSRCLPSSLNWSL